MFHATVTIYLIDFCILFKFIQNLLVVYTTFYRIPHSSQEVATHLDLPVKTSRFCHLLPNIWHIDKSITKALQS